VSILPISAGGSYTADYWRSLAEGWLWPPDREAVAAQMPTGLITSLSYSDRGLNLASAGVTYYYALSSVDDSAQASVLSAPATLTVAGSQTEEERGNSVSSSISCFISSASFISSVW
jgi:hypothetical protein